MSKAKMTPDEQIARLKRSLKRIDAEIDQYTNDPSSGSANWRAGMVKSRLRERQEVLDFIEQLGGNPTTE